MTGARRTTAPFVYYSLVSLATSVVIAAAGAALLALVGQPVLSTLVLVIAFLVLEKSLVAGLAASFAHSRGANPERAAWFIGWYEGRLAGLIIGVIVGARLSQHVGAPEWAGALAGALTLYFAARRFAGGISSAIATWLSTTLGPPTAAPPLAHTRFGLPSLLIRVFSIAIAPALFLGLGVFLGTAGIAAGGPTEYLALGRIAAMVLSAAAIAFPWGMRARWETALKNNPSAWRDSLSFIALGLSGAPAMYGLVLFLAFGASLTELVLFAAASSAAAIVWTAHHPVPG